MDNFRKRLLFIDLGGSMGGVESYLLSLTNMLSGAAAVYAICVLPELAAGLKKNGVMVWQLPRFGGITKPLRFVAAFILIVFLLLRYRIDLLQANGFLETIFLIPARILGRETVYTRHGPFEDDLYSWYRSPHKYLPRFLAKTCIRFASHVVCVSEAVGKAVRTIVPVDRLTVIPNWVPKIPSYSGLPQSAKTEKHILYVGRLEKYKGLHLLIDAVSQFPEVKLTVVGDGGYRKDLELLASRMKNVVFAGFQRNTEPYYAEADIFVMPSMGPEGLPMVSLEAMAHGLPCLFSDLPVHQEITDSGNAGMLFSSGDTEDLRRKLALLIQDAGLRAKYSREGYEIVKKRYNPEIARESYIAVFGLGTKSNLRQPEVMEDPIYE